MAVPLQMSVQRRDGEPAVQILLSVPTDLKCIEEAVDLVARQCQNSGFSPHIARFNLRVALCEALANAIVYGNGLDPDKTVEVCATVTDRELTLEVSDQGSGFRPDLPPDPTLPETRAREEGRGLFLIRRLVDDVYFNDRGNTICMVLRRA